MDKVRGTLVDLMLSDQVFREWHLACGDGCGGQFFPPSEALVDQVRVRLGEAIGAPADAWTHLHPASPSPARPVAGVGNCLM